MPTVRTPFIGEAKQHAWPTRLLVLAEAGDCSRIAHIQSLDRTIPAGACARDQVGLRSPPRVSRQACLKTLRVHDDPGALQSFRSAQGPPQSLYKIDSAMSIGLDHPGSVAVTKAGVEREVSSLRAHSLSHNAAAGPSRWA
jgi:hypothetical protein